MTGRIQLDRATGAARRPAARPLAHREGCRSAAAADREPDGAATGAKSGPDAGPGCPRRQPSSRDEVLVQRLVGQTGGGEVHLPATGLEGVEREADGEHGDGQIVHLSEHRHDAGDEVDRGSEVGGGRQQRRTAVLRDGRIAEQRDRQPKVAGGMSGERRPGVSRERIRLRSRPRCPSGPQSWSVRCAPPGSARSPDSASRPSAGTGSEPSVATIDGASTVFAPGSSDSFMRGRCRAARDPRAACPCGRHGRCRRRLLDRRPSASSAGGRCACPGPCGSCRRDSPTR